MNILREMIRFLTSFKSYSIKRLLWLFFALTIGFSLFGFSFVSCAPGIDEQASGDGDDGDGEPTRRRRNDDDDDEDDGDKCRGNESCERVCEAIYEDYSEQTNCMDEGDLQVGRLEKVHNLLMKEGRDKDDIESDLQTLSKGEDDVDINHFEDYLEIGTKKWIAKIEDGLEENYDSTSSSQVSNLIETLKWLVEDKEVAEILSEVDTGKDVLEALLVTLNTYGVSDCLGNEVPITDPNAGTDTNIWGLDVNGDNLTIAYAQGNTVKTGTITFDKSADTELYDSLSCIYVGITNRNVFSYVAREDNGIIFDMAFELLSGVCDVEDNTRGGEEKVCRKALMCYTAWLDANVGKSGIARDISPSRASQAFWDMVEEHSSELHGDYKGCTAEDFAEFFN